ncbi:hypothetical protein C464_12865 [Halorubrum coriense DSM 10284]|uniref:Membrane-bound metal-dependent hydrolase n=1 Tax=Halorubrum coriense DSM 10284 TaxID=1227466 RepID=M0ECY8_9EURY|nr:hypothetical protein C464_12865 [Halorubrum coriense DSM 10284]
MLPLGHLAFAYLWYVPYAAVRTRRLPAQLALVPLAIGSQFPDMIDKPLAYLGILPYGRSLAHSVFAFALCSLTLWWVGHQLRDRWQADSRIEWVRRVTPAAFVLGYASHLIGDSYRFLLAGEFWSARFLVYPLVSLPTSPADDIPPWIRLFNIYRDMGAHPQLALIGVAGVVFVGLRARHYWNTRQTLEADSR